MMTIQVVGHNFIVDQIVPGRKGRADVAVGMLKSVPSGTCTRSSAEAVFSDERRQECAL